jgi:hypothetical protein
VRMILGGVLAVGVLRSVSAEAALPNLAPGASEPTAADGASAEGGRFTFLEENDALGHPPHGPHTDNFYTQGARVSIAWTPDPDRWLAREIARLLSAKFQAQRWGAVVGQDLYTPSNIRTSDLATLQGDRPNAGWLYAGATFEAAWSRTPSSLSLGDGGLPQSQLYLEVFGGVTGPDSYGQATQQAMHEFFRTTQGNCPTVVLGQPYNYPNCPPPPQGWDKYQTANRLGGGVASRYSWEVLRTGTSFSRLLDATGSILAARLSLEGQSYLSSVIGTLGGAAIARAGLMEVPVVGQTPRLALQAYLYVRVGGYLVGWNELIDGPLLNDVSTEARPRWGVAEVTFGGAVRFWGVDVSLTELVTTPEMTVAGGPGPEPPWHHVGQIQVSLVF